MKPLHDYRVKWEIDIQAHSPKEAAQLALKIQRDKRSTATVFDVRLAHGKTVRVDLRNLPEKLP